MSNHHARPSDKYLPLGFVAFFMVIFVVNGIMVYLAVSTRTGVVIPQAYERGLNYNQYLTEAEAQQALGWQGQLFLRDGQLRVELKDKAGTPLQGARIEVQLMRPVQEGMDFRVTLAETASGDYIAPVTFPQPGLWTATLDATWNQHTYRQSQDLIVKP